MKKLRIYLDTSVINFVFADDAPDFMRATIDFFENYANFYELYISDVVVLEIDRDPDIEHRKELVALLAKHRINMLSHDNVDEIRQLANRYIEKGVLPKRKMEDAMHVAYATVYEMDILLSWNFKHLANVKTEARILAVNVEEGYRYPLRLVSPLEVLHE